MNTNNKVHLHGHSLKTSEPLVTIQQMRVSDDEQALHRWLSGEGFTVITFRGDGTLWGYTHAASRTVGLWDGLTQPQRLATLLHEREHVRRGDNGHQPASVERRIDETVALQLIDPRSYAWAESQFGWHTGAIAAELGVPRWVVQAYRRVLARLDRSS